METIFVVVVDAMGVEDFLLARNFLQAHQDLVDLTSMKIMVRAPFQPLWQHAHTQVGDSTLAVPIVLSRDLLLQPFERTVVRAEVVTANLEPLVSQDVVLNVAVTDASLQNVVFF